MVVAWIEYWQTEVNLLALQSQCTGLARLLLLIDTALK